MGGLDEGQIPAVHSAGAEPEHGATHPGHGPEVKPHRRETQYILLGPAVYCFVGLIITLFPSINELNERMDATFMSCPLNTKREQGEA